MPVVNLNQIMLYMQNTESSLEEALKRFNLKEDDLTDHAREELNRQVELHNKNVARQEEGNDSEPTQPESDYEGQG
jgi:exonuclease VII small subunit